MKNERVWIAAALGGLAWFIYTREKGLTLTGQPANVMLPPGATAPQSLVRFNDSTSTWATNVFSAIGGALRSFTSSLQSAPGNGPRSASSTQTGIAQSDVQSWGLAVPRDEPAPAVASQVTLPADSELGQFWSWGYGFNSPVPLMDWTLNPGSLGFDPNYIPPPPGR